MHSFPAHEARSAHGARIHSVLAGLADEVCGTLARLLAYGMTLALLGIGGLALWEQLREAAAMDPSSKPSVADGWSRADRSFRAFGVGQFDPHDKTEAYEIFRHPLGGRRDVFRWNGPDSRPVAELEIYRPGAELDRSSPAIAEIAARMDAGGLRELEAAGLIDSKFGPVTLFRLTGGSEPARACLGFLRRMADPPVRISGWSCQGDNLPARRTAISCMLNRMTLLGAGNDPKLAELFAHAELKRSGCAPMARPALSADWVTSAASAQLRSALQP